MNPSLRVAAPGLLTTVQDRGRVGYQHLGIGVSGALDPVSMHAANLLVGNPSGAGSVEVACLGPTLVAEADKVGRRVWKEVIEKSGPIKFPREPRATS